MALIFQRAALPRVMLLAVALSFAAAAGRAEPPADPERGAIERVIPLLERAAAGSAENRECFTCHNQALPVLALTEARVRGFEIDATNYKRQLEHTSAHLERNRDRFLEGKGTGGKADTAGYALWTLAAGDWPDDATTAAVAEYLLQWQSDETHWSCNSHRPPSEASDFTTTCLALRGLTQYGTDDQQKRINSRVAAARDWLATTSPQDNEDRVFRLWGLKLAGADEEAVTSAAGDLVQRQHEDGGWSQLDEGTSDAYATATALVALHETGSLTVDETAYRRGVSFLLETQLGDGSWHVASRSDPFQAYFETGFPHGDDQFISTAASAWAAMALLYTQPKRTAPLSGTP